MRDKIMRKVFGLIALLISSAVLWVSPVSAHDRDDYRYNNGYPNGGYTYSYPYNYGYGYDYGYAAPNYYGYGVPSYGYGYSAPSYGYFYGGHNRRHEEHERREHQRNYRYDYRGGRR
jgi:hypothetical protein